MAVISITDIVDDLILRDFDASEESLLVTETDNLAANEQPVVSIGEYQYKLGVLHPKTNKVVELNQMRRITNRLTSSQLGDHITKHAQPVKDKQPDIIIAFDDWVSEEGNDIGLAALSFILFSIINRVPVE